ncbi:MAG: PAS domain-containing protein [bacterium]
MTRRRAARYATRVTPYAVAAAAVVVALLLRVALIPFLGARQPFAVFYGAVIIAAWAGGRGPALCAAGLGLILGNAFMYVQPAAALSGHVADLVGSGLYFAVAGAVAFLGGAMHDSKVRAEVSRQAAEQELAERRAAEARLREQAELIDLAYDAILVRDLDGRVTFWSPGAQMTYGFSADEARGRLSHELLQTELAPQLHGIERALLASGRWDGELRHRRRDGSPVTVSSRWVLRRDERGVAVGVLEVNRDISRAKQIEAALRESEERFRLAAEAVNGLIYDWDPRSDTVRRSRGLAELVGFAPAEAPPTNTWWQARIHPDDEARCQTGLATALTRGERFDLEYRIRHHDGRWVWVWDTGLVVRDAERQVVRVVGSAVDITARREAEDELRQSAARKDRFLATLAHELRNPLGPIRNAAGVLRLIGPAEERVVRARQTIERQVHHMARLIDDLLDVSRITRGHVQLRLERVELSDMVRQAVDQAQPLIDAKQLRLVVDVGEVPVHLNADPVRLVQVITNLLNNAAKYTAPHGELRLGAEAVGESAVVRVRDNGMGIAAALLPTVFDMFVQGKAAAEHVQGGLGIGLTLVRELVELHGGRVEAHSEGVGHGAEFVVTLPAVRGTADALRLPPPVPEAAPRVLRVLVVEDNADAAESFAQLLELVGHRVRTAADGPSGVAAAQEFAPDVAFIDIGLPGIDGYEVARRIRAQPELHSSLLIALSGYGQSEDQRRAHEAGFDHHVTKPVEFDRVRQLLAPLAEAAPARPLAH